MSSTPGFLDPGAVEAQLAELGDDAGPVSADALEAAQQLIYNAWETGDHRRRMALAKQALELSPLCADAYVLLAGESDGNLDEMIALYRQGVAAAEEALGKASFRDLVGHFWGILETRPYMRARHGLAQALWNKGLRDEAVTHYLDMLRLNPGDNQGIRYVLIDYLLTLGRDDDAARLIRHYKDDGAAAWAWSGALLAFRRSGDSVKSGKALAEAMISNAHVAELLLGDKKMPRKLPAYIGMGDKNEAVAYVHGAAMAWAAAPDALAWLRRCRDGSATARSGRD